MPVHRQLFKVKSYLWWPPLLQEQERGRLVSMSAKNSVNLTAPRPSFLSLLMGRQAGTNGEGRKINIAWLTQQVKSLTNGRSELELYRILKIRSREPLLLSGKDAEMILLLLSGKVKGVIIKGSEKFVICWYFSQKTRNVVPFTVRIDSIQLYTQWEVDQGKHEGQRCFPDTANQGHPHFGEGITSPPKRWKGCESPLS